MRASGSIVAAPRTWPEVMSLSAMPTVAISGAVKMFAETCLRSSGETASPSECHIAIRPCIAATDASASTPVQSPAA